jgi:hypothetical protein
MNFLCQQFNAFELASSCAWLVVNGWAELREKTGGSVCNLRNPLLTYSPTELIDVNILGLISFIEVGN